MSHLNFLHVCEKRRSTAALKRSVIQALPFSRSVLECGGTAPLFLATNGIGRRHCHKMRCAPISRCCHECHQYLTNPNPVYNTAAGCPTTLAREPVLTFAAKFPIRTV